MSRTPEALGPRPPGTSDWPPPLLGPRPASAPRVFPERARRAPDAGEEAGAPSGAGGEAGKALEGCPDVGALPGRGTCGFLNGGGSGWTPAGRGAEGGKGEGLGKERVLGTPGVRAGWGDGCERQGRGVGDGRGGNTRREPPNGGKTSPSRLSSGPSSPPFSKPPKSRKLPRLQELQANPAAASRDVTSCRADCCAAPAGRARRCPSGPRAARAPGCTQRNGDGHTERRQRPTPEREPGRGRGGTPSSREGDKNGMEPAWPLASPSPGPQGSAWAGSACLSPLLLPSLKASGVLVPDQGSRSVYFDFFI